MKESSEGFLLEWRDILRLKMLEKLLQGTPLSEMFLALVLDYEMLFPETCCAILLVDQSETTLSPFTAPHLPEALSQALENFPIGPGQGACGTAAFTGQRVVIDNLATHPYTSQLPHLLRIFSQANLKACWSEPIKNNQGKVLGTFAIYRNKTDGPTDQELEFISYAAQLVSLTLEQYQAKKQLQESEHHYRTLVNTIPDLVWLKDLEGRFLMCNQRFEQLLGAPEADVVGKTDEPFVGAELAQFFRRNDQAAVAIGRPLRNEEWLTFASDGYQGLFETIKTPMHNAQGQLIGVLGIARDITQTRKTMQTLQEHEELLATMFAQTTDAILLLDGETLLAFVEFNDAACSPLGYSREEFARLQLKDLDVLHSESQIKEILSQIQAGASFDLETQYRHKQGGIHTILLKLRLVSLAGKKLISCVWRDVSEERAREREQAALAQRLQIQNALTRKLSTSEYALNGEIQAFAQELSEQICSTLGLERMSIWLTDIPHGQLKCLNGYDALSSRHFQGQALDLGLFIEQFEWFQTSRYLRTCQAQYDLRTASLVETYLMPNQITGLLNCLIVSRGQERGLLCFEQIHQKHDWHADEIAFACQMADLLGMVLLNQERIETAQALQRSESILKRAQVVSQTGHWYLKSPDLESIHWSEEAANIFGFLPSQRPMGQEIVEMLYPEDREWILKSWAEAQKEGKPFDLEHRVKVGEQSRWIRSKVERDDIVSTHGIWGLGVIQDITERKQAEAELAEYRNHLEELVASRTTELQASERRFRHLIEGVKQDYIFFSLGDKQRVTYLSPSAECLFGQKMEALLGQPWYQIMGLGEPGRQLGEQIIQGMYQGKNPPPFEVEVQIQGQTHTLEITEHMRLNLDGSLGGAEGVIKNITRQKRIESELREAKDRAEKASQSKTFFLANMSHEIRTPLNAILGFSELLQQQLDERHQRYLEAIKTSGKTLLTLINDILDLSKIEAGKVEICLEPVDLRQLVKELTGMLALSFEEKGLTFDILIEADLPNYLLLDPLRLRQVLLNLLSNALKFTQEGKVSLKIGLGQSQQSNTLCISVQDTGQGISSENQARIFGVFEQASTAYRKESKGTGLGLSISRNLVALMQGELQVDSQIGQGATFTLNLPLQPIAPPLYRETEPLLPSSPHFAPSRILCADDEPHNLLLLLSHLENQPFEIICAQNGLEACELAFEQRPDLILMDIKMPVMDGIEALKQLKKSPETRLIPVVATTAFSLQQEQEDFLQSGFDAYLGKPFSQADLSHMLKRFLPLNPAERPSPPQTENTTSVKPVTPELEQEWQARWQRIRHSIVLDELEYFTQELQKMAEIYQSETLQAFSYKVQYQLDHFEIEAAREVLAGFPEILQTSFKIYDPN